MKGASFKRLFLLFLLLDALTMAALTAAAFALSGELSALIFGAAMTACAALWMATLTAAFARRLEQFANALSRTLDEMIAGRAVPPPADGETLLARIQQRLGRLDRIFREDRRRVELERRELQELVSDISHQVKTPVSNLRLLVDTLLAEPATDARRREFLRGIHSQTDKLGFLVDALVKTSRLETGLISLEKRDAPLYDTLAQAMSSIVYAAEGKGLTVTVDCSESLRLNHDPKWTAEALFNVLDNAVKYTPPGGSIAVAVERWEMSVQVRVSDTGRGIPESQWAAVFQRFYRGEDARDAPGVGIGLYLAREIVGRQGGTIAVASEPGRGSTFTIALPID